MTCVLCGATKRDKQGALMHEGCCPHFMRGPDQGGDPAEWGTLFEQDPATWAIEGDGFADGGARYELSEL